MRYFDRLRGVDQDVVYYNRGNSKAELKDYEGALLDYTEAIKINPSSPHYHYNCANTYADLHRFDEALPHYNAVTGEEVTGDVTNAATFNKGYALMAVGQLHEAGNCFELAVANGLDNAGAIQHLHTFNRIVSLVGGLRFEVTVEPDAVTGGVFLKFALPCSEKDVARELETLILVGNVGNYGNTGAPGLPGGPGSHGKPLTRILVDFLDEDSQ